MTPVSTDVKRKMGDGSKATAAGPFSAEELRKMDAYWRASNYLSVGQIYLMDNPLLREPLKREHIKPRLLGHWGTSPWWICWMPSRRRSRATSILGS